MKICSVTLFAAFVIFFIPGIQTATRGLDHTLRKDGGLFTSDYAQQIQFKSVSISHGKKGNGIEYSAGTYDSSDGMGVVATIETHPSASQARAEMLSRIKKALRIVERGRKTDQHRKFRGERAVLIETGNSPGLTYATVLWLQREELNIIESSSLQTALAFEQQFYGK